MNTRESKAIQIKGLEFSYNKSQQLININNWEINKQSQTFLYGASGSGKSTLLNLLCGILTPQKGSIELLEKPFSSLKTRQRDKFRAQHIGVIFQEFNLIPFLTIKENIEIATYFSNKSKTTFNEQSKMLFERLKLHESLLTQRADTLSVGQRQRVSIVRALINQPEILIADEPTSALDSENRDEFIHLLLEMGQQIGCTILFVSHDKSLQNQFSHHIDIKELIEVDHAS